MTAPPKKRDEKPPTQATLLVELAEHDGNRFVHTNEKEPFVLAPMGEHVETLPLRGRGFGARLRGRFFEDEGKAASAQAVNDALGVLEMRALQGACIKIDVRVASPDSRALYLDLGGPEWRVVEVTGAGWRVVAGTDAPVYFRRPGGILPLPMPERGGSLEELRELVNAGDEGSWRMLVGWLVAAMRPRGPYPVLVLLGEQGCAKSTTARALRRLIDPNRCELRSEPRSEEDLILAATNGHVVTLDNVSSLQPWLSDALCRLSTGGGIGKRKLYSDAEETLLDAQRPLIVNGIGDVVSRPDLLDRAFLVPLPRLEEHRRRREAELWRAFDAAHPRLLGALLDAVVVALRDEETTQATLGPLPRMADAACWIEAAAPALGWERGDFLAAYTGNRADAHELALEASPVALAVQALVAVKSDYWSGTATELLQALAQQQPETIVRSKLWPLNGRALTNALLRAAPTLRAVGVEIEQTRSTDSTRRRLWLLSQKEHRDLRPMRPDRPNQSNGAALASDGPAGACVREMGVCVRPDANPDAPDDARHNGPGHRPAASVRNGTRSDGPDGPDANPGTVSAWPEPEPLGGDH